MRRTSAVANVVLLVASAALAMPAAQSVPSRPRITGISHVAFRVSDAAAARRFYRELLGLSEATASRDGRQQYMVGSHQYLSIQPGLPPNEDERLLHLAFATPDVGALSAYLKSRGLDVRQPSDRCHESAIQVTDPDGHTIEFVQHEFPPPPPTAAGHALSNRLLHAGLVIHDEQRAHTFYRDVLGFSEIWRGGRPEGVTSWINMRVPDGTDYLEYMLAAKAPDRRQRGSMHHACLRVADIQTAWETVAGRREASVRVRMNPPSVGVNGRWQLNLFDPDGTRIELMEPFTIR